MPRSRDTAIWVMTRRAAKYRFHGIASSTTSQASAAPPAAIDSTVRSCTPDRRASQAIRMLAAVPAARIAHHLTTLPRLISLMQPNVGERRWAGNPPGYSIRGE